MVVTAQTVTRKEHRISDNATKVEAVIRWDDTGSGPENIEVRLKTPFSEASPPAKGQLKPIVASLLVVLGGADAYLASDLGL